MQVLRQPYSLSGPWPGVSGSLAMFDETGPYGHLQLILFPSS